MLDVAALQDNSRALDRSECEMYLEYEYRTLHGPRTSLISPLPVLNAVSPPIIPAVSLIMSTHTKG